MRGRHKVFLGMAAGVGKTYRMLQEGHAEAESGRDVVIGYLEPHDRPETAAQAVGLEVLPRRRSSTRHRAQEMDLAGPARPPARARADRRARPHQRPGRRARKRYEDVDDVLAAGIDVFSTVNVQHLESLNDQVADLTGVTVRETLPDAVLGRADEVVLVDLTPEALIQRLQAGKVYAPARVPAALNGFFKTEHLAALREVALRQVAEEVESRRLVRTSCARATSGCSTRPPRRRSASGCWRSSPRSRAASGSSVARGAPPSASVASWTCCGWPAPASEPTAEERAQLDALRRLTSVLGAHLLVEYGDDVADVVKRVAEERGTTYVLLGRPQPRRGLGRLREPLLQRLVDAMPGVDVRVVADRSHRKQDTP